MNDDRRSHEASALRKFFDDQIHHLQGLFTHVHELEVHAEEDKRIVESFVDASNARMRAVRGYAHKLRDSVRALYSHVLQVADEIPEPVEISADAFRKNPLVNALFVNPNDIDELLNTDPDAEAFFRAHHKYQVPVMYALLTATRSEKKVLGVGLLGDMLIHDVPKEAVNFSSHKIHIPVANDEALETALKKYLFDRVVTQAKDEMKSRMLNKPYDPKESYYEARIHSLANPDVYLDTLVEYLQNPADLLNIHTEHFRLSKLGIKLECDEKQCSNEFDVHELTWDNKAREVVLRIAYRR